MTGTRSVSSRIVAEHGWDAHARVHELFQPFVQRLYDSLDAPLAFHLITLGLERGLVAHIRFEEATVLPLFAERVPDPPPPGVPANFLRDHELIKSNLERLLERSVLAALGDPVGRHLGYDLVALDKLFEHHDERELTHLYPALATALAPEEQAALLESMAAVPLVPLKDVGEAVEELDRTGAFLQWRRLWDAWALRRSGHEAPLPAVKELLESTGPLDTVSGTTLGRLLRRDRDLVERFSERDFPTARVQLQQERTVDQTLRSTLRFALTRVV